MNTASQPSTAREAIGLARQALRDQQPRAAIDALRRAMSPHDDASVQGLAARLARDISASLDDLPVLRVALLGKVTLDHLVDHLRLWLLIHGLRLDAHIVPFGTWPQQVRDASSALYAFKPDVVWFFSHLEDLGLDPGLAVDAEQARQLVEGQLRALADAAGVAAQRTGALVLANNLVAPVDRVYGNLEGSSPGMRAGLVRLYNERLAAALPAGASVFDMAHLAARLGLERWEDERLWAHSKHPFSLAVHGRVAHAAARVLAASRGGARKCVVLDLDNTMWGGVVGDDGVDGIVVGVDAGARGQAHARFQAWLKGLASRGIALAVCSKNEDAIARAAFGGHPGMVLKLDDIAVFRANWDNKADNLRAIARELNIGLDALVFVDDNPAERALIRAELPQVAVPELPPDPADYIRAVADGMWFETLAVSDEDRLRTRSFRENAARAEAEAAATDLPSYLRSLRMRSSWGPMTSATLPRVAQLINKTNQFHPTTTRHTAADLARMAERTDHWVAGFGLQDRFGDNGLISAVVLHIDGDTARIDTWAMSCRVFSRTMEQFIFATLCREAVARGARRLVGEFLPTAKNGVVARLYPELGGVPVEPGADGRQRWLFTLEGTLPAGSPYIEDAGG